MKPVTNAVGFDKEGEKPFKLLNQSPIKEAFENALCMRAMTRGAGGVNDTVHFEYLGDKIELVRDANSTRRVRWHIFRVVKDRTLKFVEAPPGYTPPKRKRKPFELTGEEVEDAEFM